MTQKRVHVAVGAIADRQGRILLARRPRQAHQGGRWEFPGGKLEPGEGLENGLARELREEVGIRVIASEPLIRVHHDYDDRQVLLDVRRVTRYAGRPHGCEGQPLRWQYPADMDPDAFPAADRPIIQALRLPDRMLITGADPTRPDAFLQRLAHALDDGVRLVQLRAPELDAAAYRALAEAALALCRSHGATLVLNPPVHPEGLPDGAGLHLNSRRLWRLPARPLPPGRLVGASCHGAEDLRRSAQLGLDYALLSPLRPTASHPEASPLGWVRFAELVEPAALPVFALGGLQPEDIPVARRNGGQGIAAIRGLWPAAPPPLSTVERTRPGATPSGSGPGEPGSSPASA
jgi:8-oxo-dGTP diphosphatase